MRAATAILIASHGVGFSIWFMSAWTPSVLRGEPRLVFSAPGMPVTGGLGKGIGLVAVVALAGFLASGWGVWQGAAWWPVVLIGSSLISLPVAAAVWNPVGIVSVPALLASVVLIAATLRPWGERFLGAH
jgi:hypothetical protein